MNPREALEFAKKHKIQMVDLKFVDLIGTWQHFSIPVEELTEGLFKDGSGLDGSSIRGWKAINDSDLLMIPDPTTACLDPFCAVPTMSLVGNVVDPITREPYDRDPRFVAQKAEKYLQSTKIGDTSYWGPEAEFFIFDQVRYDQTGHSGFYFIDSEEGAWNIGPHGSVPEPHYSCNVRPMNSTGPVGRAIGEPPSGSSVSSNSCSASRVGSRVAGNSVTSPGRMSPSDVGAVALFALVQNCSALPAGTAADVPIGTRRRRPPTLASTIQPADLSGAWSTAR